MEVGFIVDKKKASYGITKTRFVLLFLSLQLYKGNDFYDA